MSWRFAPTLLTMDFALEPGRRPQKAVRKVATERLDLALASLGGIADDPERSIHETRKRIKELRALLRLVRSELGPRSTVEDARLRSAAAVLGAGRDAQVQVRAFDRLVEHAGPLPEEARDHLAEQAEQATHALLSDPAVDELAWTPLLRARSEVADWRIEARGFDAYADGLRRTYTGGRRRLAVVRALPHTEELHSLRTATKRLWYQTRLLRAAAPELLAGTIEELDQLGELLGDDHDLAVLHQSVAAADLPPGTAEHLGAAIEVRRAELQADALPRLERLYAERPGALVERFTAWWALAR